MDWPNILGREQPCFHLGMLLAAGASLACLRARIVARQDLRLWHSVGGMMYVLQWCCGHAVWQTLNAKRQITAALFIRHAIEKRRF